MSFVVVCWLSLLAVWRCLVLVVCCCLSFVGVPGCPGGPGGQGCLGGRGGPGDQVCQCIYGLHGLNYQIIEKT